MTCYFIGAGPGDPELITVKGQRLITSCPVVLYAGSLVPEAVLQNTHSDAVPVDTAALHLGQIVDLIKDAHDKGLDVARVHSGDPSIYGAVSEQVRELQALGIPFEIVPGVTATSASAALLGRELTLPDVSQTVIYTRYAGKTSMPEGEDLSSLAAHRSTLAIHLGVTRIHKIVEELIPFYGADCPVAVVYKASWPDEDKVVGTLADIVDKVREKKFVRTSLILVGRVLDAQDFDTSHLYDKDQAHIYRKKEPSRKTIRAKKVLSQKA